MFAILRNKLYHKSNPGLSQVFFSFFAMLHAILIINKAGGLIYNRDFGVGINKLTSNEYLVLAGTFHGYNRLIEKCEI